MMTAPLIEDVGLARLGQALEDNCAALFRQFAESLGGELVETAEGGRHLTSPDNGTFKGAWRSRLTVENADAAIDETIAWFKARNAPYFHWWTHAGTTPDDLGHRLVARGFESRYTDNGFDPDVPSVEQGSPVMVADMRRLDESLLERVPSGFRVTPARTEADLDAFCAVVDTVYPSMPDVSRAWTNATRRAGIERAPWRLYVAWLDDEPVATNIVTEGGGIVGLWVINTVPSHRRKGIGAAVTIAPLLEWRDRGYRYAGLFASDEGALLYERIGFAYTGTRINRLRWVNDGM
jgi:GNAT superfamily N-acetyltransferase